MPSLIDIKPIDTQSLARVGFTWFDDERSEYLVKESLIKITEDEGRAYYDAANILYEMYEEAAEYVMKNDLFEALDIPKKLIPVIKTSWKQERENHLYGRFDLSGGIDGLPIKLIEFNADTPTLLVESTLVQLMLLEDNKLTDNAQFNNIYENVSRKFKKMAESKKGAFSRVLFACVDGNDEERQTVKLLEKMAQDAGLVTEFSYLEDVDLQREYEFFFKLYPWEDMEDFEAGKDVCMLNPAYSLLYQSKGMLAILYKLFPDSPYLLETDFCEIEGKYVKKTMFGREGANIEIHDDGKVINARDGVYGEYKSIYQRYTEFAKDGDGVYYQAGVFYSDGSCGLGFRRGSEILDNGSQFIGHIIQK